jgi:hypothetical protein
MPNNTYKNQIDTVRGALVCDMRTTYAIAKASGVSELVIGHFRTGRRESVSTKTLITIVPHVMPGMAFGLHKVEAVNAE